MTSVDAAAYLARLGLSDVGFPSVEGLRRLHAAHVERVPFETLYRPSGLDLDEAFESIVWRARGGTCFHLNGVFSLLLGALGYQVNMHPAGVQSAFRAEPPGADGSHIMLTVSGLPADGNPAGRWVLDVGTGEGFHAPLPLRPGIYRQGDFHYRVRPSQTDPNSWRIDYDQRESCRGVDFADVPASREEYAVMYDRYVSGEWSLFHQYGWVKRHHAGGYDELLGCLMSSVTAHGRTSSEIITPDRYFSVLRDTFWLTLAGTTRPEREALWQAVRGAWNGSAAADDGVGAAHDPAATD